MAIIALLQAQGGNLVDSLNGDWSYQYQAITDSFPLSYQSFLIPAGSMAVFEVGLSIGYLISPPGGFGGSTATVTADFANDNFGYRVTSLALLLEIVGRRAPGGGVAVNQIRQ